jgi:predicted nucleotidyltransferase
MTREEVIRILSENRAELSKMGVRSLAVFGSVARNEASPDSDVDLLVEFSQPVGLFQFITLKQYLETLLGTAVDLGTARSLKPRLKENVLREAIYVA